MRAGEREGSGGRKSDRGSERCFDGGAGFCDNVLLEEGFCQACVMHNRREWLKLAGVAWLAACAAFAQAPQAQQLQSAAKRPPLGVGEPTPWLLFDSRVVPTNFIPLPKGKKERGPITNVTVAGTWSSWTGRHVMTEVRTNLWRLDSRTLGARVGRHEFKFIVNGEWEGGANRVLPINLDGEIEKSPAMIQRAVVDDFNMIRYMNPARSPRSSRIRGSSCS